MKRLLFIIALLAAVNVQAQTVTVDASVELFSAYIWRGDKVCGTQMQPSVTFGYKNWALQSFGFQAIDGSYKEIDWDLSYKIGAVSLHFADYFYQGIGFPKPENYFDFNKNTSTHVLEGIICYDPENLPFAARWFTFVFGSWLPSNGQNAFSSYLELEAFKKFENDGKLSLFVGSSVLKGPYTAYKEDFMPIHLELRYTRDIEAGGITIPVTAAYIINPYARTSFLNAGVGIRF